MGSRKKQSLLAIAFLALLSLPSSLSASDVISVSLSGGWQFVRGDLGNVWEAFRPVIPGKPESVPLWTDVSLPHCYNATDAVNPYVNYYQGPAWYRACVKVENPYGNGRTMLHFEGAGQKTTVYVYNSEVGSHVGGYDEFDVDITQAVADFARSPEAERFKGLVPIAVRCDNSRDREMIPSDMSDFNLYGGLYRNLSLRYVPRTHVSHLTLTPVAQGRKAFVDVSFRACCKPGSTVVCKVYDGNGIEVGSSEAVGVPGVGGGMVTSRVHVRRPGLWSPDRPTLYECRVSLRDGDETFEAKDRFGFRNFEFMANGPFMLNGKRTLLRGTHRHDDHAGLGAAVGDSIVRRELGMMKDMGVNFIRLGHYQQSELVLRLCDSLGIMVWEEIPWCRGGVGGTGYREQAKRMLRNMIAQHRNHPSVIMWGLGNEIDWPGDFSEFSSDSIRAFLDTLNAIAHVEDSTRPTCIRRCDFAKDIIDVYSPTIWAGWYSNSFRDYQKMERKAFESTTRFIHAEWGGDSHAGRHSEDSFEGMEAADRKGDWSETYIVKLFDWHLKEQERMPWLSGSAFWTFKDFSTPLRPRNPIPYVNQKGVVQRDLTPKESYYVFQSYWASKPMLHVYGHSWPVRWGRKGEAREVLVYSNCKRVELFVNGVSQGVKVRDTDDFPAAGLRWNVVYGEGDNVLKAVSRDNGVSVADSIVQRYQTAAWGEPARIGLGRITLADGRTAVEAVLTDAAGNICLDAADFVTFGCTDRRALLVDQGTAMGSSLVQLANGRARIVLLKERGVAVSAEVVRDGKVVSEIIRL